MAQRVYSSQCLLEHSSGLETLYSKKCAVYPDYLTLRDVFLDRLNENFEYPGELGFAKSDLQRLLLPMDIYQSLTLDYELDGRRIGTERDMDNELSDYSPVEKNTRLCLTFVVKGLLKSDIPDDEVEEEKAIVGSTIDDEDSEVKDLSAKTSETEMDEEAESESQLDVKTEPMGPVDHNAYSSMSGSLGSPKRELSVDPPTSHFVEPDIFQKPPKKRARPTERQRNRRKKKSVNKKKGKSKAVSRFCGEVVFQQQAPISDNTEEYSSLDVGTSQQEEEPAISEEVLPEPVSGKKKKVKKVGRKKFVPEESHPRCRKVYGAQKRTLWCKPCKWKKQCERFFY